MAAEIFESIGRRNETLSEQLAHATAMFDEQFEQLKLAEIQINDYKLELEKQAELIEELQQQCSELESQLHQPSLYRELKEAEESICCSTYNSGDSPATSIRSSPSLLEEFSALNINFDEIRFYQTIDELRAEKFQLEEEKAQSKEDNDKKMSELQVKFAEEKAMLEEKISTLQRRSSVPSWLTILFVAILFIICARLLAFINSGDEHFTVFGTWPHTMIDYITKPPV
uniref:Uncharacterized protein n=1 Tax=Acrobeloides nanus TaxID=290746 RepID=A0A914CVI5_9BILA